MAGEVPAGAGVVSPGPSHSLHRVIHVEHVSGLLLHMVLPNPQTTYLSHY